MKKGVSSPDGKKYDALNLANSIIIYTKQQEPPYNFICLLKLMKLSYIALGNYLAVREDDFFEEDVEVWRYGPVIPSIWHEYKEFSLYTAIPITRKIRNHGFAVDGMSDKDYFLWALIIDVCDKYKDQNANKMVAITHGEGTPWFKYKKRLLQGERGIRIKKNEIRQYYRHEDNRGILVDAVRP